MLAIKRTSSMNQDFVSLVKELDTYLKVTDGEEHEFYNQFNGIEKLNHCIVAYLENQPVGCGAFKKYDAVSIEIKRMYLKPNHRGSGIAFKILNSLEIWAKEMDKKRAVLETGKRQVEALKFYQKSGYQNIPNYGQYIGMDNSQCFEKIL
jgi:GNAT superfamily N-acetyltransferase